ncbi:MAG TPA: hypothetical protein VGZ02_08625 [Candidatus Baltobacteraceae bacterium]|nr:hypothetical protein [Candidatus Baltobacteraceae bacterium]
MPAALCAVFAAAAGTSAQAMPVFAKAYGVQCSTCHTVVPQLNAYGRYVQRTGYSSLNRDVLKTVAPIWFGEQVNGDSTGGVSDISPTHTSSFGNFAVHGAGYIAPDWTFHVQQWMLANDSGGGPLDTAWVTYNNLLHRDGHLFIGKIEAPGPSVFSMPSDISAYATPEITVGEHAYLLDANRWGTKLSYVHGALDVEAGYLLSPNGFLSSADWAPTPGTDKTFQWKVTSAHADQPLEIGAYGSIGSYIVSTNAVDHYNTFAPYVERDPQPRGIPGFLGIYQFGNDSNPGLDANGLQLPSARSRALTAEVFEPLFNQTAVLGLRDEFSSDGLGNLAHSQVVDFATNIPKMPYFHAYVEAGLGANSAAPNGGPTWRWLFWWTTPIAQ